MADRRGTATRETPAAAGPLVAGPLVAGPLVAGPLVAGPLVAGPLVAGPLVVARPAAGWLAAKPRAWSWALLLAVVAAVWIATRPYQGVVHDSRLYTLQALSAADPARFADDPFLRFGSQDRFTVFSHLYAPVLGWAGVSLGAILLTLLGQAAWLCGAYSFAKSLFRDRVHSLAAVVGLVALPSAYGAQLTFSYGEPFVTPRLFAEAFTMLALGRALRGAAGSAAAALAVAAAFHPVMAFPGAAAFCVYKALGARARWAAAVTACAAGAAACGLAALGVEPFARLGVRLDPVWFEIVSQRVGYTFIGGWSFFDWSLLAGQAALAVLAAAMPGAGRRRMIAAVLVTAAAGLGLTFVGADLAGDQLLINLQPWRAAWLLGVTAHLAAVPLLMRLAAGNRAGAARGPAGIALAAGVAVLALARFLPVACVWSAVLLTLAAVLARRRGEAEPVHRALVAVAVAAAGISVAHLAFATTVAMEAWPEEYRARLVSLGLCVSGLGLTAAVLRSGPRLGGGAPGPVLAASAAFLLLCAALGWDQRTAWTRFVESPAPLRDELAGFVSDRTAIYWDGGAELLWLRLKRPSYHSCLQGAGVMFFRETAITYNDRNESFRFDALKSERCKAGPDDHRAPPTRDDLRRACAREPGLDDIVLPHPVAGVPAREWTPPATLQDVRTTDGKLDVREFNRFYAYSCGALR